MEPQPQSGGPITAQGDGATPSGTRINVLPLLCISPIVSEFATTSVFLLLQDRYFYSKFNGRAEARNFQDN